MWKKNYIEIQEIPSLDDYPDIQAAIEKHELVIFIGAGVSRLVGCKSWEELAYGLLKKCLDLHLLDYHEFEVINNYNDEKKKISIAYGILNKDNRKEFFEVFNNSLKYKENKNKKNIYDYLSLLADTFVTTNSDSCFDQKFIEPDIVYDFSSIEKVSNHKLYHIHGSNKYENSLVFTSEQYLNRYNNRDSDGKKLKFLEFLNHLFSNYTVLFIGYGLAEFELLDYLTLKAKSNIAKRRHYALMPYFSFEKKIMQHDQLYYDTLNIQIIPYAKDRNGYNQLIEIADQWSNKNNYLSLIDTELHTIFSKKQLSKNDYERVIGIISRDEAFLRDFLSLCSKKPEITPNLLTYLYKYGLFKPEKKSELWPILGFLYIYIEYCRKIKIYRNITIYKKIIDENIDGFENKKRFSRTDNMFLELIFCMEEKHLEQKYFDFIKNIFEMDDVFVAPFTIQHHVIPKILKFKNKSFIKKIVEIVFAPKVQESDFPYVFPKIGFLGFKEIAEKYSEKIYTILETEFVDILVFHILRIPKKYRIFILLKNYDSDKPIIGDDYITSVLNILVWILDKCEHKEKYLNKLKDENQKLYETISKTLKKNKEPYKFLDDSAYFVEPEYTDKEIKNFSIEEILNLINQKEDTKHNAFTDSQIQNWIMNCSEFSKELFEKFLNIDSYFSHSIIYGLYSLVREKKVEQLNGIKDILWYFNQKLDSFIGGKSIELYPEHYNSFCIQYICLFISQYIYNNITKINKDDYASMDKIILKIYNNLTNLEIKDYNSFRLYSEYLNSETGACFEAIFFLYAYSKEILKEKNSCYIKIFEKEISSVQTSNFLIMLGKNIPYFFYFDKEWLKQQLLILLKTTNNDIINALWSGFYYTDYNISDDLFMFLKEKCLLEQLINTSPTDPEYYKKIADILLIMYLRSVETLDDNSLLKKMILNKNKTFIEDLINSIVFRKKVIKDKYENLLINLWSELTSCLNSCKSDPDFESTIIKLLSFVELVNSINDKVYNLIKFSIISIPDYRIDHFMVPQLLSLYKTDYSSNSNIEKILIDFGNVGTYFSDFDNSFSELFLLIKTRNPASAKEIANIYMKHNDVKYLNLLKRSK